MNVTDRLAILYVKAIRSFRLLTINVIQTLLFKRLAFKPNSILINRDGAFGDSIVALPAIDLVRQNYPETKIDLLNINNAGVNFSNLPIKQGLIDELFSITKKERKQTLGRLRNNNYDLFIQLPQNIGLYKSIRNMILVRFYLNIKHAIGWDAGRIKSFLAQQKNTYPCLLKVNVLYQH